ncbi:unnamed protein product [Lathyrus oleraceus]
MYNVSFGYDMLLQVDAEGVVSEVLSKALSVLWRAKLSSKIQIFIWRLFLDLLATKNQLIKRGMNAILSDYLCVICGWFEELSSYVFFSCAYSTNVLRGIIRWLGFELIIDSKPLVFFSVYASALRKEVGNKAGIVIWAVVVSQIWLSRNDVIFRGNRFSLEDLISSIKVLYWSWLGIGLRMQKSFNYYDWYNSPVKCLKR